MKNFLTSLLLIVYVSIAIAQHPSSDNITLTKGKITIQPILHASLALTYGNKTIYVDPHGGAKAYKGLAPADLILITDIHPDHLDTATLNTLDTKNTQFIVPLAVADKLPDNLKSKSIVLNNGQNISFKDIKIAAIAMYNLPESKEAMHTRGRGNGYVLTIDGKNIYISGDTGDIFEMRNLKNIDVAFVCMNLPYTMSVQQAASAVLEFKPKVVYPYHYRGKDGLSDVEEFKKLVYSENKEIEVRLRNWYPEY